MRNLTDLQESEIICYCLQVNKGTIVSSVKSGNNTLSKIKESTKACTGADCKAQNPTGKCCSAEINELIRIYSAKQ
jgi:NAD(P)H-nitrite reductase large subunit